MPSIVTVNPCFQTLISVRELRSLAAPRTTQSPPPALIDCRFDIANPRAGLEAYRQAHIPGASYADLEADLSSPITLRSGRHPLPEPRRLRARFAALGVDPVRQTVVYDAANGAYAARAWWLLRWLGIRNSAVLDGGFSAWVAADGAVESHAMHGDAARAGELGHGAIAAVTGGAPAAGVSAAAGGEDREAWLSSEQVLAALGDAERLLIDARAPERFSGKNEPLDPVAGHVAGAVNHPFVGNLGADGRFLPSDELRRRWLARLGGVRAENAVMMCGSGVTACHNVLAVEHAGLGMAKLYPGSWSEWIKDPARPVARG